MRQRIGLLFGLFSLFMGLQACSFQALQGERMRRTELYFGLEIPEGGTVNEQAWEAFVREQITPKFPEGLTVLAANGQWQDNNNGQVVREASRIVILLYKPTSNKQRAVEEIRRAYQQKFRQQAVMRIDSKSKVRF